MLWQKKGNLDEQIKHITEPLSRHYQASDTCSNEATLKLFSCDHRVDGYREILPVREGLVACIGDIRHIESHKEYYVGDEVIKFHFRLEGDSQVSSEFGDINDITAQTCGVLIQPGGLKKAENFGAGEHERSLTLFCQPTFISELVESSVRQMPEPIQCLLKNQVADYFCLGLRMPPEVLSTVRSIFENPLEGGMRELQIQAKSLELMCQIMQHIASVSGEGRRIPVRKRDIERVAQVCDILDKEFSKTPKLGDLARAVGWNETQLTQVYREVMGVTVFEYRHRMAMERALELIKDADISITQVAYEAGYEYPSNFSTAFRKHYDMTPAEARKRFMKSVNAALCNDGKQSP